MTDNDRQRDAFAAWFLDSHGHPDYDLCATEEEAATAAAGADVYNDGTPLGLQRADGTLVPAEQWSALAAAIKDLRRVRAERWRTRPAPTRPSRDPFTGTPINIEVTEPEWLGKDPS
jgi:hypothetical protein